MAGKNKRKPNLKDVEKWLSIWRRLVLNSPVYDSLHGQTKELADDLLASKLIYIDQNGCLKSTISGRRRLRGYKNKLKRAKRDGRNRHESKNGPDLRGQDSQE